ncbi:Ig-like domain-containing protein [Luteimicrobium sp. NPDC057192]|uniref:Ig-like domain-containing protein n=1 Tax=Luteimicrobium sp. NPDC057192 TaxID=3346042 RepID=UPI0036262F82
MGLLQNLYARRKTVASVSTVSVVSTAMVALALTYRGEPTAKVELNDSGVWVTRATGAELGRFNTAAQALDATLVSSGTSADVLQEGTTVLASDPSLGTLSLVDVADSKLKGTAKLPASAQVGLGGGATAVLDTERGHVWVVPAAGVASFDQDVTEPVATVKKGAALAVGPDGTVHVADPSGTLTTVTTTEDGTAQHVSREHLDGVGTGDVLAVTAVGSHAAVLDVTSSTLYLPGHEVEVEGTDPVLQQAGGASSSVAYATTTGLVSQPLDGSEATVRTAQGRPVSPVQVGDCTYGAWSGSGQVLRDCTGTTRDLDQRLAGLDSASTLRYRVNRSNVVLNDLSSGTVWLAADQFQKVDDWEQKVPEHAKGEQSDAKDDKPEQVDKPITHRTDKNRKPVAKDDRFGVRPGRSTVLPVLSNDTDPDGDVLAAQLDGQGPGNAAVSQVMGGDALLATTDDASEGVSTFRYRVTDGRGGADTATVRLTVVPYSSNKKPDQTGEPVLTIVRGGTGTIKVLPYFRDPDGDDLYLADATAKTKGDEVRFERDGTVEYRDAGATTGRKAVSVTVSDGLGGTTEGTLWVDVKGAGNQPPVAVGDHAVTQPGQPVTVSPLRNDTDPNAESLRLATVEQPSGAKVTPNYDAGTFQLVADRPGSYVGTYQVSDGPAATTGVYRVDVVDPGKAAGPPVAVPDTALLPSGGQTLVDVLANDSDPAGGVLVVQSVEVPDGAGVTVAVLGHSVLRITETRNVEKPVTLRYTVSNGTDSAVGQVRVVRVPPPSRLHAPNATADEASVHVGDVVTIPVLANDTHPDGLELLLQPKLAREPAASLGTAFVSDQVVRFQAGSKPGTAYLIYRVRDKNGQEDSAQVTVHVLGGAENSPPKPPTILARTVSGGSVTITPQLDGTDPDGDSVRLTGIGSPASKGTATVTAGTIVYTAAKTSTGTDTFQYEVQDRRGQQATGTVRVGIAPPPTTNQPPVAVDDAVTVRPGRAVSVAPLTNDSDPDGDRISLVSRLRAPDGLEAGTEGNLVVLTAPEKPGTSSIFYTVQDTHGARASGAIVVTVDSKAPLRAPVAKDDVVSGADVVGKTAVAVPVLANDSDPDGAASALTVTTAQPGVTVGDDGVLSVPLTDRDQVFRYTVTDPDGLTGSAFVWVPALQTQVPTLRADAPPLTVRSGEPLKVDIRSLVRVADGKTPRLTTDAKVKAVNGTRVVTDVHRITFTSDAKFVGQASLSFEVTDGTGPGDPKGHVATLTVPITVTSPQNLPPVFSGRPAVDVGQGDHEPGTTDLAGAVTDPDGDALTFKVAKASSGLHAEVDADGMLSVTADPSLAKGSDGTVAVTVTDGQHPAVAGQVHVAVVASNRHVPVAVEDDVPEALAGQELAIPVLANDVNPFADDGKPLTLTAVVLESGSASQPVVRGDEVVVTPDADFHGQIALRYSIQDATKDPDRQVDGQVLVTVQGHPDAPAKPEIGTIESHQVTLSWSPPNNNGADITSYTVTPSSGAPQKCVTTTCTITGLTNDQDYTFTVVATNAAGDSEPSPASDTARPDERPDAPDAPTLEFGDGELTVTWTNRTYTDRSAIEKVNLQISPAAPDGSTQLPSITGTTTVWKGLKNGVAYKVQVQAVNGAPEPSDWGAWSATETPAGKPAAPAKPSVARKSLGTTSQMQVTWVAPVDNGGALTGYDVQALQNGSVVTTVTASGSATSATVDVGADTTDYTFRVRAKNKATEKFGDAEWSPVTDAIRAFAAPGSVAGLEASPTGSNSQVALTWDRATAAGLGSGEIMYQYTACGGGWTDAGAGATSATVTCGDNGTPYTYQVRAVPDVEGVDENNAGPASSATATPYGPLPAPEVSASAGAGKVTFTWSTSGNGRDYTVSGDTTAKSGSKDVGGTYPNTIRFCVTVTATSGAAASQQTCATGSPTKPHVVVSSGPQMDVSGCTGSVCHRFDVTPSSDFPSGSHSVECMWTYGGADHSVAGHSSQVTLNAGQTTTMGCVAGHNNGAVAWVIVDGVSYKEDAITWPN